MPSEPAAMVGVSRARWEAPLRTACGRVETLLALTGVGQLPRLRLLSDRTLHDLHSGPSLRENAMRKTVLALAMAAAALLWGAAFAQAQQFGTAAEAKAMLDRAIAELKANEAAAL